MNEHGLYEHDDNSRGGVATCRCFEEPAGGVCSLLVGLVSSILNAESVVAEARLLGVTFVDDANVM